jgi:hypothetical protein
MDARMRSLDYPDGVTYLSLKDVLCDELGCLTMVGPDLQSDIVVWDYGHLTVNGAEFATRMLIEPILSGNIESTLK